MRGNYVSPALAIHNSVYYPQVVFIGFIVNSEYFIKQL